MCIQLCDQEIMREQSGSRTEILNMGQASDITQDSWLVIVNHVVK